MCDMQERFLVARRVRRAREGIEEDYRPWTLTDEVRKCSIEWEMTPGAEPSAIATPCHNGVDQSRLRRPSDRCRR